MKTAHLDIKPENFVLGKSDVLKLIDLSFAAPINMRVNERIGSS